MILILFKLKIGLKINYGYVRLVNMNSKITYGLVATGIGASLSFGYRFTPIETSLNLGEAIQQNKISCLFSNNIGFSHFDKCLLLKIENRTRQVISIVIPAGTQVNAGDSSYQNLVVTEQYLASLEPGQKKALPLYAMCTEPRDRAPGAENISYQLNNTKNTSLTELAVFLAKEKMHNSEGQNAVWAVSANEPIANINGFDTTAVRKLQTLVAKLTHQKMPSPAKKDDYKRNYYSSPTIMKVKVGGTYSFNFSSSKQVLIGMFDTNNVLVRELYKNENELPGRKTINYAFDATVYTNPIYYMRLLVNGEKKLESKIDMN